MKCADPTCDGEASALCAACELPICDDHGAGDLCPDCTCDDLPVDDSPLCGQSYVDELGREVVLW